MTAATREAPCTTTSCSSWDEGLYAELRSHGLDARHCAVTYLVEMGRDRDDAFAALRQASGDGWRASLYGDGTGWVLRLNRVAAPRPQVLDRDQRYLELLARTFGGLVRGVSVEPLDADDAWDRLAARCSVAAATAGCPRRDVAVRRRKTVPTQSGSVSRAARAS